MLYWRGDSDHLAGFLTHLNGVKGDGAEVIIGLNRENVDSLLRGDVFTLPHGMAVQLPEASDIVLLFAETDEDLGKRFQPSMCPV